MSLSFSDIGRCLGAEPILRSENMGGAAAISGAAIDSRALKAGDIFFCLKGEHADGHDFAFAAAAAGAAAIVAERDPFAGVRKMEARGLPPVFVTPDVHCALGRLAGEHRSRARARVVGVTGTAGKTTVKEVLAAVLAECGPTDRNPMNLNNQIGLPLSMLNASGDASFWVMEAGISEARDMDELGAVLRPDLALVLNAGQGHTLGLGDRGVAYHKARLLHYLAPGGEGLVSADYPELAREAAEYRPVRYFSARAGAVSGREIFCRARYDGPVPSSHTSSHAGQGRFTVSVDGEEHMLEAPFRGSLGAENVAAVTAVARMLGLDWGKIGRGLARATLPAQRCACETAGAFTLVDDSYNANPLSAERMLEFSAGMARESGRPLILVMGEMLELGNEARQAHKVLGGQMAAARPALIFWKGGHADAVREGLRGAGYAGPFYPVGGGQEFTALWEETGLRNGLVLFKGSRGNRLERLVSIFRDGLLQLGESDAV